VASPTPGPRFVSDRMHQMWITPHGILKAAMKNDATLEFQTKAGKSVAAVRFTEPGRFAATAWFNDQYQLERVESRFPDPGATRPCHLLSTTWRHAVPRPHQQSIGGHPTLSSSSRIRGESAADFPVPEAVAKSHQA
jgi:hypothetical protein